MNTLRQFQLPIRGLSEGTREYSFEVDDAFFRAFEASPIPGGRLQARLVFDKQPRLFVLDVVFSGTVRTECDRCLAAIDLPVSGDNRLFIKLSNSVDTSEEEDTDIVVLPPETEMLDVAQYLYEYIVLSLPLIKTYDCRSEAKPPCNEDMLALLNTNDTAATEEPTSDSTTRGLWDTLKNWKNNDN